MSHPIFFREPNAPPKTPPLMLFFETKAIKDEKASQGGPPIYDTVDFVKVVVAGSRGDEGPIYEIKRLKDDGTVKTDQNVYKRFGRPYEEWKAGQSPSQTGTPLEQWPLMDVAMVAAFKASHVYTVQQLAELNDAQLDTSIRRGGREWRAKAQAWLEQATSAAGDVEARARCAKLEEEVIELKALLKESLKKQNTQGFDPPKKRPRKVDEAEVEAVAADAADLRL